VNVRTGRSRTLLAGAAIALASCAMLAFTACSSGGGEPSKTSEPPSPPTVESPFVGNTATPDQSELLAVLRTQTQLAANRDWPGLYATYSPGQQAACSYDRFLAKVVPARDAVPDFNASKVTFDRVRVRIDGDHAAVSYVQLYDGQPVGTIGTSEPDVYIRINGRWYDDVDTHKPC
jgi:hypothetical protein